MGFDEFLYHTNYLMDAHQLDEMMITNMISILGNPNLSSMLSQEQLQMLSTAVTNHVVIKAAHAINKQQEYMSKSVDYQEFMTKHTSVL